MPFRILVHGKFLGSFVDERVIPSRAHQDVILARGQEDRQHIDFSNLLSGLIEPFEVDERSRFESQVFFDDVGRPAQSLIIEFIFQLLDAGLQIVFHFFYLLRAIIF